jgi:hypothetical protein
MRYAYTLLFLTALLLSISCSQEPQMKDSRNEIGRESATMPAWMKTTTAKLENELLSRHGENQKPRIRHGLKQTSEFWRESDGNQTTYEVFIRTNFLGDQNALDMAFNRFQSLFEQGFGHMCEIRSEFRQQMELALGPVQSYDELLGSYDPSAHLIDDFFNNKLAFVVLLNFPLSALEERLAEGEKWTHRQWAETNPAEIFSVRIPAALGCRAGAERG